LRGSAGFSPASLPGSADEISTDKDARAKEVEKEQNPPAFDPSLTPKPENEWTEV